ncbi:hypothetical protein Gpo141_00013496 [Globisporangium polare]
MAPQWSSSEVTALLRAWREDLETPTSLSLYHQQQQQQQQQQQHTHTHTLFQRFVALCGGHTQRSEVSVLARRDTLKHMWTLISKFESELQPWFALPEWEKRVVFAKQSQAKSYSLLDISRAMFLEVDQIMTARQRQIEREQKRAAMLASQSQQVVSDTEVSCQGSVVAKVMEDVETDSPAIANEEHEAIGQSATRQEDPPADDSGSSTESDEDFIIVDEPPTPLHRSPVREQQRQQPVAQLSKPSPSSRPRETFEPRSTACRPSDNGWRPILTHKSNKRLKPTATSPSTPKSVRPWSAQMSRTHGEATKSTELALPGVERDGVEVRCIADDLNAWLETERLAKSPSQKSIVKYMVASMHGALDPSPRSSEPAPTAEASVFKHTTEPKAADIKSSLSPDTLQPVPPLPESDRDPSDDTADRLTIQANELRSVFVAFRKMSESDAALTNQFLEEVQRDMADRERVKEQVRQLEESIEREKQEWALEKARFRQDWEELQRRLERSED